MINYFFDNITFLFFPLTVYIIYVAYLKNIDEREKEYILDFALFGSVYLLFRNINQDNYLYTVIFVNMALLICYLKKHIKAALVMSLLIIIILNYEINIPLVPLIIEYSLYLFIYSILKHNNRLTLDNIYISFVLVRIFFNSFSFTSDNSFLSFFHLVIKNTLSFSVIIFVSYITLILFKKCEDIIDFNSTVNELNREKEIKTSLFKITHEIKNPLSVCRGYLDMILDNDYKNYKKYIPIIDSEIRRTLVLMDDFLDYTKLKIEKEEVDIVYMLEDLVEEIEPLLKKNDIKLEFSLPDDEIYMNIDYKRMKQVFINAVKNSIEAKKDNMTIGINIEDLGDDVKIIISDTGIGMDNEVLSKIGENFYTTKPRGTGLGVSLSKEIVKLHDGKMIYDSVLNEGTKLSIILPKINFN